ncbi:RNA dependent RNA polymerase-domain-containing protein [Chytriomyces cf. hyalinus JEL632]|nr:RNA dependent RNA polymerase-domain-containing protein [Chytriomyces cf. hyalinus JEL632]
MELVVEIPLYVTNKKSVERAIELAFAESDVLRDTRFKLFKRKNETNGFLTAPNEQAGIFIIMAGKWCHVLVGLTEIKPRKSGRRPDPNVIKSLLHSQPTHKTIAKKDGGGQKDIEQLLGEQLDHAWDDSDGASQSSYSSNWSTNMPEAPEQDLLDETEVSLPVREIWFGVWVGNEATQHLPDPNNEIDQVASIFSRVSPSAQSPVVIAPGTSGVYARKHQESLKKMLTNLPIRIVYQLSILLTWNVMFPTELVEFVKKCVIRGNRPNFCKRFETIVTKFHFVPDDYDKGKYNTTYRLYVTLTGMYIDGPFLETSNRVIRQYKEYSAHFLHVAFVDEDGAMFRRSNLSEIPHDIIYEERFCTMLKEGIRVAGRLFKFLAFSNSSLKEERVLFFHEPSDGSGVTVETFTSTASTVKVLPSEVNMYFPDVERNNYNFSDGIGTVSEEIASEMWDTLKKQDKLLAAKLASGFSDIVDAVPSAFQIRFGGAKGLVSVDPSLPGRKMNIRQSMIKFEAKNLSIIEVADYSSVARDAYFNRQIILILEDLGVPKQVFLELQRNAVREFASMWGDKTKLIELAGKDGAFGNFARLWETVQLSEWLTNEFVRASFEHIRAYLLKEIKYRARFKIRSPQETKVLTGPHIIYRSPVIHPGDIQPVVAVDIPQFRHLHHVIVFSQHGKRDLPSQLGGGDLDGDISEFRVAADYAVTKPDAMDRPVTMDDISEFIFFMVNDRVGRIARRHLALADQRDGGSTHPDCLVCSELHNQAVDFAKSGKPASMAHAPKPRGRPDFMYRPPNDPIKEGFYKSSRAMGLMYRDEELNSMIDRTYSEGQKERILSDADPLWRRMKTRPSDWESYLEDATKYQFTFENEMERIANYTRPKLTELELWTGYTEALMKKGKSEKEVLGQAVANYYISNIVKKSEKFGCVFGLLLLHHIAGE